MSLVHIVIPVYNQAHKLVQCLESVQKQTFQDFSITIVDDGSTDNVLNIVKQWLNAQNIQATDSAGEISTKTVILSISHKGAPSARNEGAKNTRSEFLLFLDSDVICNRNFLEEMVKTLKTHPDRAYAYSSFRYGWKKFKLLNFDEKKLRQMPYIHTSSLMRAKKFPGFDESLKRFQDWDLWLTMMESGDIGIWIPKILFKIQTGGAISKWRPKFAVQHSKSRAVKKYHEAKKIIMDKHGLS